MFPHVAGKQRCGSIPQRVTGIALLNNLQFAIILFYKPCPSGTEEGCCSCRKLLLKFGNGTKVFNNNIGKSSGRFTSTLRLQAIPVKRMVPYLGAVVEYTTTRFAYNLFQRGILEFGSRDQFIQVVDVGLVMLSIMKFYGTF